MLYAKQLREQKGRNAVVMQAAFDRLKTENRGFTPEERESWDRMATENTRLDEDIVRAEKMDDITADLSRLSAIPGTTQNLHNDGPLAASRDRLLNLTKIRDTYRLTEAQKKERDKDPLVRVFSNYLRLGLDEMQSSDKDILVAYMDGKILNTTSTTTNSQGGYLIPQGFSDKLDEAMKWYGGIEGTVEVFTTGTGNPLPYPLNNDTTNKGRIIGQNVQVQQTDPVFSSLTFNAYIGSSDLVLIPLALIQDSYFDLDTFTAKLLGTRLGRLYNNQCTVGTGSNAPMGIINAVTGNASPNVTTFTTGQTTSIIYNNLVDIQHSVDPAYREGPSVYWMFHDTMLKTLKKLVDGQSRPLWQPGLTASFREGAGVMANKPMILDSPYMINNDMAVPAANAYTLAYGDMSKFKVREVAGGTTVIRLTERYADYLQIGYIAYRRFDSNLVDSGTHPIGLGQQSAS